MMVAVVSRLLVVLVSGLVGGAGVAISMLLAGDLDLAFVGLGFGAGCVIGVIFLSRHSPNEIWDSLRCPVP